MIEKSALAVLRTKLSRLRVQLSAKAYNAYDERDSLRTSEIAQAYAAGEAHAYGDASDEVRAALVYEDGATGHTGAGPQPPNGGRG